VEDFQRVFKHCEINPDLRIGLEHLFFVKGKDIDRYWIEDEQLDCDSDFEETESDQEDELSTSHIILNDDEATFRLEKCWNCKEIDLAKNKARACRWHSGLSLSSNVFHKLTEIQENLL